MRLIGPNGAGKTTLFNSITRINAIADGEISFAGQRIDTLPARQIISVGIARTFQNLGIYPGMTVMENVALGAHHSHGGHFSDGDTALEIGRARARNGRVVPLANMHARS